MKLPKKESDLLEYIYLYYKANGRWPSYQEISSEILWSHEEIREIAKSLANKALISVFEMFLNGNVISERYAVKSKVYAKYEKKYSQIGQEGEEADKIPEQGLEDN